MERYSSQQTTSLSKTQSKAESEIHQVMADFAQAICDGHLDDIMAFYAPDVVAFDMMPPLEFLEKDNYQQAWEEYFTTYFEFPLQFQFIEQRIFVSGDLAMTYGLAHLHGTGKNGKDMEAQTRYTCCLQKKGGKWMITHEHKSVPLDLKTSKGLMNLKPERAIH